MKITKRGALKFVFGVCSVCLALAWGKFVGVHNVYFPPFPDYLDVVLGIIIGIFLIADFIRPEQ